MIKQLRQIERERALRFEASIALAPRGKRRPLKSFFAKPSERYLPTKQAA